MNFQQAIIYLLYFCRRIPIVMSDGHVVWYLKEESSDVKKHV